MKDSFVIFTIILLQNIGLAQHFSVPIQVCIDKILANGEMKYHVPAQVDSSVLVLSKIINFENLEKLSEHKNPLIRVAALVCLVEEDERHRLKFFPKNNKNEKTGRTLMSFLEQHLTDTAIVRWRIIEDDKVCTLTVADIYLKKIGSYFDDSYCSYLMNSQDFLNQKERYFIDSLLVNTNDLPKEMRKFRISQLEPIKEWYEIVKNKAKKDLLPEDIIYLAKYRKEDDIDFILTNIIPSSKTEKSNDWERLLPFKYFKHQKMFDFLQKELNNSKNAYYLIGLIAAYKDSPARDWLYQFYEKNKTQNANNILQNIESHYTFTYDELAWKILKENSDDLNLIIPKQLWKSNFVDSLVDYYYILKKSDNKWVNQRATNMFLDLEKYFAEKKDSRLASLVMEQIPLGQNYYYLLDPFEKIWKSNDTIFTKPLFDLLAQEPLGENRFFICKILLHQPEKDIENQLIAFFQKEPTLFPILKDAEKGGVNFSDFLHKIKK